MNFTHCMPRKREQNAQNGKATTGKLTIEDVRELMYYNGPLE